MRLYHLTENQDYALAQRVFQTLSHDAQDALSSWEWANWDQGVLSHSFEHNDRIAQEIKSAFAPIQADMKRRHGNSIKLYRGISPGERQVRSNRQLFSWTSSQSIASHFAGADLRVKNITQIGDEAVQQAIDNYNSRGFTTFRNKKYMRNRDAPQYYNIYNRHGNYITDGDDIESEIKSTQQDHNDMLTRMGPKGKVISREVPVDNIVWVLMGGNANEYIVSGFSE